MAAGPPPQCSSQISHDQSCTVPAGLLGCPQHPNPTPGAAMPRQVDYYFSFQSPWAYIGHNLFREVAKQYDLKVNYKPVVLVDLFSETGGLPLMKRHPVRQRYRQVELHRWRDKRGP